jgi:hypothetical protein
VTNLTQFLGSESGLALQGLVLVAFADFATGVFAAVRDGTFQWGALAAFVRKHLLGRVAPIAMLLALGYFGGSSGQLFMAGALGAASAYILETIGSVWGNLRPPKSGDGEIVALVESPYKGDPDTVLLAPPNSVPGD